MTGERKDEMQSIIQIQTLQAQNGEIIIHALCEDGAIYQKEGHYWKQVMASTSSTNIIRMGQEF
jgi:hypothetical protein